MHCILWEYIGYDLNQSYLKIIIKVFFFNKEDMSFI